MADRIPGESPCAQAHDIRALRTRTNALLAAGRVPAELQETLSSGVNALVEQTPPCLPTVEPAATTPTATPPAPVAGGAGQTTKPKPHRHGHGHGKGHEKK